MPKENKKQVHYIYKIIFLCGKPGRYYLGKHSGQLDDCYAGSGSFCKAYYKKYGKKLGKTYIKEILEINPNKKVNALREKEIIGDLYKSDPLCMNFIKGGNNPGNYSISAREKISKALKGNKNGNGHFTSESLKEKMRKNTGKKVIQYDLDGNKINEFDSIHVAAESVNGTVMGVSSACNRKIKTYLRYIWRFANDLLEENNNISCRHEKRVIQLDLNGNYISEYHSVKEAYYGTGISRSAISLVACGKRKTAGGYKWMYKEDFLCQS